MREGGSPEWWWARPEEGEAPWTQASCGVGRREDPGPLDPGIVWCGEEGRPRPPGPRPQAHCLSKLLDPGGGHREKEAEEDGMRTRDPLPTPCCLSAHVRPALTRRHLSGRPSSPCRPASIAPPCCNSAHLSAQLCPDPFWNAMPTQRPRLSISGPPQPPLFTAASTCRARTQCTMLARANCCPPFLPPYVPSCPPWGGTGQGMRQRPKVSLAQGQAFTRPSRAVPPHLQGQQPPPAVCVLQHLYPLQCPPSPAGPAAPSRCVCTPAPLSAR